MKSSTHRLPHRKANHIQSLINLQSLLYKKYSTLEYDYAYICTYNLIFNEKCLIVSHFKDFLIYDDLTEFLRRYYTLAEVLPRLSRILAFFDTYSKIFPNYTILPAADHLFRNIRKKQKMIDAMNAIKQEEEENRKNLANTKKTSIEAYQSNCNVVFTPKINKSILKYEPSRSITESSISTSIWAKKSIHGLDNSFAKSSHCNEENNANDNSIDDLMNILNGKLMGTLPDCYINVQTKQTSLPLSTQRTPRDSRKTPPHFFYNHNDSLSRTSRAAMALNNRTAVKCQRNQLKYPETPINRNFITPIGSASRSKPVNNLNIITNNYESIVIPQPTSGGSTVININNNFFSCSDLQLKRERHSRVKSASPPLMKRDTIDNQSNKSNPKVDYLNADFATKTTSRSIKREVASLLSSFNLQEKFISQSSVKATRTSRTQLVTSQTRTKSVSKSSNSNTNNNYNTNDNPNKPKTNTKYSANGSNLHSNQLRSPIRERELNKERILTNEIRHKFKMFIERSKLSSLANRGGLSSSISPKKSLRNQSSSNMSSAIKKYSLHNMSQNCSKNDISTHMKMIDNLKNRVTTPLAQSINDNANHRTTTSIIKVNTKPYFQRASSSCLRKAVTRKNNNID